MDTNSGRLARVIADYQAPYANPIVVDAGDEITVDISRKTDWIGWVWCTNRAGLSGWVPEIYIERHGNRGRMSCSYNAIEMTIHAGEILTLHKAASGFYWATNHAGQSGWVPSTHIRIETT